MEMVVIWVVMVILTVLVVWWDKRRNGPRADDYWLPAPGRDAYYRYDEVGGRRIRVETTGDVFRLGRRVRLKARRETLRAAARRGW